MGSNVQLLDELRRRMAEVPGRVGDATGAVREHGSGTPVPPATLPVPAALAGLLPDGGLAKGSVIAFHGTNSLLSGLLASVTEAGGYAAVVGLPRLGLLAAAEMGAELSRLAVIPDPGADPAEIAAVLLDGLDLVVLGLGGRAMPPARCRVLAARARNRSTTLVVTDGDWANPALRLDSRIAGYRGLGAGRGRLRSVCLDVRVRSRSGPPAYGRLDLCAGPGRTEWRTEAAGSAAVPAAAVREATG